MVSLSKRFFLETIGAEKEMKHTFLYSDGTSFPLCSKSRCKYIFKVSDLPKFSYSFVFSFYRKKTNTENNVNLNEEQTPWTFFIAISYTLLFAVLVSVIILHFRKQSKLV